MFHHDFDYELGRERMVRMRTEIEHDRLEARLAKATRSNEDGIPRRGWAARGATVFMALFR